LIGEDNNHARTGKIEIAYAPLIVKNRVFLPNPQEFEPNLVPTDKTLKFTIRHQIQGISDSVVSLD
jgi:hypothetical protein